MGDSLSMFVKNGSLKKTSTSLGFLIRSDDQQSLHYRDIQLTMDALARFVRTQVELAQCEYERLFLLDNGGIARRQSSGTWYCTVMHSIRSRFFDCTSLVIPLEQITQFIPLNYNTICCKDREQFTASPTRRPADHFETHFGRKRKVICPHKFQADQDALN